MCMRTARTTCCGSSSTASTARPPATSAICPASAIASTTDKSPPWPTTCASVSQPAWPDLAAKAASLRQQAPRSMRLSWASAGSGRSNRGLAEMTLEQADERRGGVVAKVAGHVTLAPSSSAATALSRRRRWRHSRNDNWVCSRNSRARVRREAPPVPPNPRCRADRRDPPGASVIRRKRGSPGNGRFRRLAKAPDLIGDHLHETLGLATRRIFTGKFRAAVTVRAAGRTLSSTGNRRAANDPETRNSTGLQASAACRTPGGITAPAAPAPDSCAARCWRARAAGGVHQLAPGVVVHLHPVPGGHLEGAQVHARRLRNRGSSRSCPLRHRLSPSVE